MKVRFEGRIGMKGVVLKERQRRETKMVVIYERGGEDRRSGLRNSGGTAI